MKYKINITLENRDGGPGKVSNEVWENWKSFDNGTIIESESSINLINKIGDSYSFSKVNNLLVSKTYNKFIEMELSLFNIYEAQNPLVGYLLLYRFKDINRKNEFVLSGICGIGGGSSINFKANEVLDIEPVNVKQDQQSISSDMHVETEKLDNTKSRIRDKVSDESKEVFFQTWGLAALISGLFGSTIRWLLNPDIPTWIIILVVFIGSYFFIVKSRR